jgi:hypothetical protein
MGTGAEISLAEQIAALEPLSAAALALCLAYLALDRFRYRNRIQSHAASILQDSVRSIDGVAHTTAFGSLTWLAGQDAPNGCLQACAEARTNGKPLKDKPPLGFKSSAYNWLYKWPLAEFVIFGLAVFAFFALTSGVLVKSNVWAVVPLTVAGAMSIKLMLILLLLGCAFPATLVWLGRLCVDWGISYSNEMGDELQDSIDAIERKAKEIRNEVQELEKPKLN